MKVLGVSLVAATGLTAWRIMRRGGTAPPPEGHVVASTPSSYPLPTQETRAPIPAQPT